jgi:hypothetical protein
MLELLFLLGFTLHNLEEALWLPAWSKHAKRFHREVQRNEFHFAALAVTIAGYLLTFLHLTNRNMYIHLVFYGFVLVMCANAIFPHLLATIIFRRYAPGLLTGLFLNLPIGLTLVQQGLSAGLPERDLILAAVILGIVLALLINPLFKLGGRVIDPYQ